MKDADQKPVIRVKNVYKIFKLGHERVRALNGVSVDIYKGQFVAIVGTSGSGKSTFLNMVAGLDKPTKGEIIIAGHHIEKLNESRLVDFRREHVGFIFQAYNLLPQLSAVENVALPLSFRGIERKKRESLAKAALTLVGLEKYYKHKPTEMSGGQQQRVGIARALVTKPEIIFADEPTGNLDSHTTKEILELMQMLVHETKMTLVMVTHDNYLASFADRRVKILDGEIVSDDGIDENPGDTENSDNTENTGEEEKGASMEEAEDRKEQSIIKKMTEKRLPKENGK